MTKQAFSIVELIVAIAIMAILLTIGVVNFRSSQASSNDQTRAVDVDNFKLALESFYKTGFSGSTTLNRYPSTDQLSGGSTSVQTILPGFDLNNLIAPDSSSVANTLVMATNNSENTTDISPPPTTAQYVYQPLTKDFALCTSTSMQCQSFNIYYRRETDNVVVMVSSVNQ